MDHLSQLFISWFFKTIELLPLLDDGRDREEWWSVFSIFKFIPNSHLEWVKNAQSNISASVYAFDCQFLQDFLLELQLIPLYSHYLGVGGRVVLDQQQSCFRVTTSLSYEISHNFLHQDKLPHLPFWAILGEPCGLCTELSF